MAELNDLLVGYDAKDDQRRVGNRTNTIGFDFAHEAMGLRALPAEPFDTAITLTPRVDRHARITVRQIQYSVPAGLVGRRVRVKLGAESLTVFDGRRLVATHARATTRGAQVLVLDHYLDVLTRKPGALPGSLPLAQARATGMFTATHEAFWAAARAHHTGDDRAATIALIEVLLLHRTLDTADVLAGIQAALAIGSVNPDVVAVQARHAGAHPTAGQVVPLAPRLTTDTRPTPTLHAYDDLLTRKGPHQ